MLIIEAYVIILRSTREIGCHGIKKIGFSNDNMGQSKELPITNHNTDFHTCIAFRMILMNIGCYLLN